MAEYRRPRHRILPGPVGRGIPVLSHQQEPIKGIKNVAGCRLIASKRLIYSFPGPEKDPAQRRPEEAAVKLPASEN